MTRTQTTIECAARLAAVASCLVLTLAGAQPPPPPPPPIPYDHCMRRLFEECNAAREPGPTEPANCKACVDGHAKMFNCTAAECAAFCAPGPHPPPPRPPTPPGPPMPKSCFSELLEGCGQVRDDKQKCLSCAEGFPGKVGNCTKLQEQAFCKVQPPAPPAKSCTEALEEHCLGNGNLTACTDCIASHADVLKASGCTPSDESTFCKEQSECSKALSEICGFDRGKPACMTCARNNAKKLKAQGCTLNDETRWCSPTNVRSSVDASTPCATAMAKDCGAVESNITLCWNCLRTHASDLTNASCTPDDKATFCHYHPAPPHGQTCTQVLSMYCSADQGKYDKCMDCVGDHATGLEQAHCTDADEQKWCHGTF